MLKFLNWLVTWWNGHTIGTWIFTKRHGRLVGEDVFGNAYYQTADGKRRWVLYRNIAEASLVPAEWHGWLHGNFDGLPESNLPPARIWEVDFTPNVTGTSAAYRPQGALERGGKRAAATGDYEAWSPEG
jgi:NADH:ubiquinone oxidoreductase subunit